MPDPHKTYEPDCGIGEMMGRRDQRGSAALEFCCVAVPWLLSMFVVFDLGRYAITMHSLHMLADAGARLWTICQANDLVQGTTSFTNCTGDPLPLDSDKQAVAPFLYTGGLTPTLNIQLASGNTTPATVTASQPSCADGPPPCFRMLMPIWGTVLNRPSASTAIPF
jgi:Flp pilus assembly protein TadG